MTAGRILTLARILPLMAIAVPTGAFAAGKTAEADAKAKAKAKAAAFQKKLSKMPTSQAIKILVPARKWDEDGIFGLEFEFTNGAISKGDPGIHNSISEAAIDKAYEWADHMRELCRKRKDCTVKTKYDWYSWTDEGEQIWHEEKYFRVEYKDGFYWQINYDPGVLEIQTSPMTAKQARLWKDRMQTDIFDTATQAMKLRPVVGETHIHAGVMSNFGTDLRIARNDWVDSVNHQEFIWLFSKDGFIDNATPMSSIPSPDGFDRFKRFAGVVEDVDIGAIQTFPEMARKVRKKVYDQTLMTKMAEEDKPQKFHDYNVQTVESPKKIIRTAGGSPDRWTVERRSIPAPQNAEDLVSWVELRDARIKFLRRNNDKRVKLMRFKPDSDWEYAIANFKAYVEESGLEWERFKHFVPEKFRKLKLPELPGTLFEDSQVKLSSCVLKNLSKLFDAI